MTEYRTLSGTDLKVSRACFGTMTFGSQVDRRLAVEMVDHCLDQGVNFFDTANIYQQGVSEEYLGEALRGKREKVILASKVRGKMGDARDESGLSRAAVLQAVEASLKRLRTDHLDIYYLHQPDYDVPLDETLEVMQQLVSEGKVRYPATSNYASWQVAQMLCTAERNDYQPARIAQQMYNPLARGVEQEFVPMTRELRVSLIAYNPLAGGLLTGKHRRDAITPGTRFDSNEMYQDRYWHAENFRAVEELQGAAERSGRSLISLALNWLLHHTPTDCVILGASKLEQLKQNLSVLGDGELPPETCRTLDAIWQSLRGAAPIYNR